IGAQDQREAQEEEEEEEEEEEVREFELGEIGEPQGLNQPWGVQNIPTVKMQS
ncbi:uncharacterized, partial [Tachysurus ichikawai]